MAKCKLIFCVNDMDAGKNIIRWQQLVFDDTADSYEAVAEQLGAFLKETAVASPRTELAKMPVFRETDEQDFPGVPLRVPASGG